MTILQYNQKLSWWIMCYRKKITAKEESFYQVEMIDRRDVFFIFLSLYLYKYS